MMMASIYGRVGGEPKKYATKNEKLMARVSIVVDVTQANTEEDESMWLVILAFGKVANDLLRHKQGDLLSASGRVTQSPWKTKEGEERKAFTMIADSILSSRTIRPPGSKKRTESCPASNSKQFREEEYAGQI